MKIKGTHPWGGLSGRSTLSGTVLVYFLYCGSSGAHRRRYSKRKFNYIAAVENTILNSTCSTTIVIQKHKLTQGAKGDATPNSEVFGSINQEANLLLLSTSIKDLLENPILWGKNGSLV